MGEVFTLENILSVVTLIGVIFAIYNSYKRPQESSERKQILLEEKLGDKATVLAQQEVESKASLLQQQVQLTNDSNDKKLAELSLRLDASMTLAQNHIHTVDTKVDGLIDRVGGMSNEITKLTTIIDERLPKKCA